MATQKIHFFTGKGGVGKSVVAAAFAVARAQEKSDRILLAELSEESSLHDHLALNKNKALTVNLSVEHWNAPICLEEYATNLLRSSSLSKLFLNNAFSKSLINIAPGLQELAILGKATSGPRQHGPQMNYNEIFIDSFASGHFLNLVSAPGSFSEMFSVGPIATQSKSIDSWIKNSDFTHVHIVTQADELSITESLELQKNLKSIKIESDFIFNKFHNFDKIDFKKLPDKTKKFFENLEEQQIEAIAFLKKTKQPIQFVPFIFAETITDIILHIAKEKIQNDKL